MLSAIVPILASSLWTAGLTDAKAPGEPLPPKIEAFLKHCETFRRGAILQLEHTLRGLQSQQPQTPEVARQIERTKDDLRSLRANRQPTVPTLSFPPEIGAIGRLPRLTCHVDQILSADEMLVRCFFTVKVSTVRHFVHRGEAVVQSVTFLIRGVSTRDVQEGADLELLQVFEVAGKQAFKTSNRVPSTALVLTEFDMKAVEPYFEQWKSRRP